MPSLVLTAVEIGHRNSFLEAAREFAADDPDWEFAFDFGASEEQDFAGYVERLRQEARGENLLPGRVPHTFLVAVVGDRIVGRLSLRHELNDFLRNYGGHVGFGVIPSCRRRGYATEMLRQSLPIARAVGIDRMLLTCADDNVASMRVIEGAGGVLEDKRPREGGGLTRRYWVDLRQR